MPKKPAKEKPLPRLSASDFYKYEKCPNWVYWDLFGDPKDKGDVPEMMKKLREDGVLHEQRIIEHLGPFIEVPAGTREEQAAKTLELMKAGERIYHGVLIDGDWIGEPDILMPRAEPSKLGKWTYEAVDIKSSRDIHETHKLQLYFYSLLLKRVQGTMPELGHIINIEGQEKSFRLEEIEADFFDILDRILVIRSKERPEALFTSACKDSPWYDSCRKLAEDTDDVSLIYKLYKSEYRKLREGGYATLTKLAKAKLDDVLADVKGISEARLGKLHLQAQALHEKKIVRIGNPDLPETKTELHFDIEGDPLIGVEYLFGLLIRRNGKDEYKAFIAERPEDEGRAWTEFCDFIEGFDGTPIYHYGWYEMDVIRRLSGRYGISRAAGSALSPHNMIDLVRVVQRTAIFPLYFYSLKDLCKHLGFKWRASDASGANSVLWFQEWLAKEDRAMLQKIIDYNEDDVRATAFLKDWLVDSSSSRAER